jgi:plastocyanin
MSGRPLHRLLAALVFCALAPLTLAACGGGGGGSGCSSGETRTAVDNKIVVNAFDIRFDTCEIKAQSGPLTVTLVNKGALPHTFTVESLNFEVKASGGKEATGTSPALAAGQTYKFICSTPGHAAAMHGTIVVG